MTPASRVLRTAASALVAAAAVASAGCAGVGTIAWDSARHQVLRDCDRLGPGDDRDACRRRIAQAEADARRERESAEREQAAESRRRSVDDPARDGSGRCFRRASTGELVCTGS